MAKNTLTIQDWSILTLIAETPEVPRKKLNQAVNRLDGEAKRVGLEMLKQLDNKKIVKPCSRSARTANEILHRTQCSGFVKYDEPA